MPTVLPQFDERVQEINAYLALLEGIEDAARSGPPTISNGFAISVDHQKILYSTVFLQLYNLVESCVVGCLDLVTDASLGGQSWSPADLNDNLLREWVRVIARTHDDMGFEKRLESALVLCGRLIDSLPVEAFSIDKGGGGNWDDNEIEAISRRLGLDLRVSRPVYQSVKRPVHNDLGPLGLVKSRRNSLAHGGISFVQCAESFSVGDLRSVSDKTINYLTEVVDAFDRYLQAQEFLRQDRRTVSA